MEKRSVCVVLEGKTRSSIVFLGLSAAAALAGFAGVLGGQARGHVT